VFKKIDHVEIVTRPAGADRGILYATWLGFKLKARDRIESVVLGAALRRDAEHAVE